MEVPFVDLKAQYNSIKKEIDEAMGRVISETAFIKGKYVEKFEREFADYLGVAHCVPCANGTDAIEVALRVLGIGPGDEVIVPANTWISTSESVTTAGAKVVFVDNDPITYTMDVAKLEEAITERTRAIIPVHLYGLTADMDPILTLAKKFELKVIEDCAQAHGATYKGRVAGTMGHMATFSFFPGKNLGAYGDAGAIVTNDENLAKHSRMVCDHGRLGKFDHGLEGRNSRLDGLQAAILSAKLPYLKKWTELRQEHAGVYHDLLKGIVAQIPVVPDYASHVFHLYVVQVENRERVQDFLLQRGVHTGIHYPISLPLTQAYAYLGLDGNAHPNAARGMHRIMSIPMYAELSAEQQQWVATCLRQALEAQQSTATR